MLLLLLLVATALSQVSNTYLRTAQYPPNTQCGVAPAVVRAQKIACDVGISSPCVNNVQTQCFQGPPGTFENAVTIQTYSNNQCNDPNPNEIISWSNNLCVQYGPDSFTAFCYGGKMTVVYFLGQTQCVGQAFWSQLDGGQCRQLNPITFPFNVSGSFLFAQCAPLCFHESSKIVYGSEHMTMASLQAKQHAGKCVIPHTQSGNGVAIETTCGGDALRVTNDHLVYTSSGLRAASTIQKGDILYSNLEESNLCTVTNVRQEFNQRYFGLNCEHSDVLSSGLKTSTFGINHAIPAAWMKYASKVVGVEAASRVGDRFVSLLHSFGVL